MKNNDTVIFNFSSFAIVATFFSLWLAVQFEESIENLLAYILILSFGILHGANDLKLIERAGGSRPSTKRLLKTLVYYVLFVLLSTLFFYVIPSIALLLFIIFSGYHFGEQHWNAKISDLNLIGRFFFLCYGLFILCLLFYIHVEQVSVVIEHITGNVFSETIYLYAMLVSGLLAIGSYLFLSLRNSTFKSLFVKELFYLGVFFIVFSTASLLWSFAIYFVLWHSLPSLLDQIKFLYGNPSKKNIMKYVKSSFPYWIISVIGLGGLIFFFNDNLETTLSVFFSFLAAITFPHVLIIDRMNNPVKTLNEN